MRWFGVKLSRVACLVAAVAAGSLASAAKAQQMSDADIQEMRDIGTTMLQRMNDSGIDLQSIGQQMQDGTFDPEAFQQMLIDKGVIDNQLISRMQKTGTKLSLAYFKQAINASDEEWTVLLPKFEKVTAGIMTLGPDVNAGTGQGGGGGMRGISAMTSDPNSPVLKALNALKAEIADKDSNDSRIAVRMKEYRDARDKARKDLEASQDNLRSVITIRQESILVSLGIMK